ncbi:hypothetical protein U27_04522 [Candidatus Vecturithrix granuli]|uniref:Uncharacterized protein n=1 Tax=Vecturithrix granuli TaxID=1499967 RepID=A0A081BZ00_VECG1|nr:hypothetical protein U27_04522 [Candidatus Vecturithrix granuli]
MPHLSGRCPEAMTSSPSCLLSSVPGTHHLPFNHYQKLLTEFQQFFREHSAHWVERFDYKEAGLQLLLQAFLQRILNGGGRIDREYGLGR